MKCLHSPAATPADHSGHPSPGGLSPYIVHGLATANDSHVEADLPELRNKPLVEAILELRWSAIPTNRARTATGPISDPDPDYRLFFGRFFDRVREEYATHERLPTSDFPDQMVAHVAQHRLRRTPNGWPLIQLGPGLLTYNETEAYTWGSFESSAQSIVRHLVDAHPSVERIRIDQMMLRYLDAFPFDPASSDVLEFLREKLHLAIKLPDTLFSNDVVVAAPRSFQLQAEFRSTRPQGTIGVKLAVVKKDETTALLLDTSVASSAIDLRDLTGTFPGWLSQAHEVASTWFKNFTAGELYASFDPVSDGSHS